MSEDIKKTKYIKKTQYREDGIKECELIFKEHKIFFKLLTFPKKSILYYADGKTKCIEIDYNKIGILVKTTVYNNKGEVNSQCVSGCVYALKKQLKKLLKSIFSLNVLVLLIILFVGFKIFEIFHPLDIYSSIYGMFMFVILDLWESRTKKGRSKK